MSCRRIVVLRRGLPLRCASQRAKHAITMMQVERWLDGASASPNEGVKKAKLKDLLGSR